LGKSTCSVDTYLREYSPTLEFPAAEEGGKKTPRPRGRDTLCGPTRTHRFLASAGPNMKEHATRSGSQGETCVCLVAWSSQAVRSGYRCLSPSPCMRRVGGTLRPQRCPLPRPLRVGPLLSPPRSSVSLFITLNTVLWVHE
jgi:hypothetical protein